MIKIGVTLPEVRNRWKPGYGYYPKMPDVQCQHQRVRRHFWHVVQQIGGEQGYFYGNALWKTHVLY